MPWPIAKSRMEVQRAPDCDMNAMRPRRGMPAANDAFSFNTVSIMPRTFGPTMRMPYFLAISMTCCSSAFPCGPVSRNPAVMITAPLTPR